MTTENIDGVAARKKGSVKHKIQLRYCTHLNKRQAEGIKNPARAALISINGFNAEPAQIHLPAWQDVLRLYFDDLAEDLPEYREAGFVPPHRKHARKIAEFIRKHSNSSIVAHCAAGISRSAAVCVILVAMGWKYVQPHHFGLRNANPLLVQLLKHELSDLLPRG